MEEKTKSLPEPCLMQMQFHPCPCKDFLNRTGVCFEPPEEAATGYYWYYEREGMFAISDMDLSLREDQVTEYQQESFISITCYDTISAEELNPYKPMSANCIRGHVSRGEFYRARYHRTVPVRGMELMLMPGYYHDYLEQRYPGEFPDPEAAFLSIDGSTDFPELILLMHQIRAFQGTGAAAHLFYESKVAEAVSLIIEKTKSHPCDCPQVELSREDLLNLDGVKSYIEDHFAWDIRTDQLTKIACMGQTKLRCFFKKVYGCTITEYVQTRRMVHAEYMLRETELSVSQVSDAVGYHHSGRFAALFRRHTGLHPEEYRKLFRNN